MTYRLVRLSLVASLAAVLTATLGASLINASPSLVRKPTPNDARKAFLHEFSVQQAPLMAACVQGVCPFNRASFTLEARIAAPNNRQAPPSFRLKLDSSRICTAVTVASCPKVAFPADTRPLKITIDGVAAGTIPVRWHRVLTYSGTWAPGKAIFTNVELSDPLMVGVSCGWHRISFFIRGDGGRIEDQSATAPLWIKGDC